MKACSIVVLSWWLCRHIYFATHMHARYCNSDENDSVFATVQVNELESDNRDDSYRCRFLNMCNCEHV